MGPVADRQPRTLRVSRAGRASCQLTNMRGLFSDVIADHVLGMMLCFARNCTSTSAAAGGAWAPVGGEAGAAAVQQGPARVSEIDRRHKRLADCTLGGRREWRDRGGNLPPGGGVRNADVRRRSGIRRVPECSKRSGRSTDCRSC